MDGPTNDLRRFRALGSAVVLTLGLSACGASHPAADRNPSAARTVTASDDALAGASAQERACITRNRGVVPWDAAAVQRTGWDAQHRQEAHRLIVSAVRARLGIYTKYVGSNAKTAYVMSGLLGYHLDPVGSRLIMQVDPTIVDVPEFRRWVGKVARKANKDVGVQGTPLTVTVQEGCFSAREFVAASSYVNKHGGRLQPTWEESSVRLDGRLRMGFVEQSAVEEVQRRFGLAIAAAQQPILCAASCRSVNSSVFTRDGASEASVDRP